MSNQYLSFDVTKQAVPQQLIIGRQGDSQLKFVTMLFWDGDKNVPYDLTGKQVAFEALKPDNTHIVDYEGITILDAPAGLVRYSFNEQVFSVAGTMEQAFFKITHTDRDDNVIADSTLEVVINILENRVEFGINSKDYLSEYDKLVADVKKKFDDYATTVQDSIDKAKQVHDEVQDLIAKINNLQLDKDWTFTGNVKFSNTIDGNAKTADSANDPNAVHKTGNEEVGGIKVYENAIYSRNKIPKKMISITIARYIDVPDSWLDTVKRVGASLSLCVMVPVQNSTDSSPVPDDLSMLINFIKRVQAKNIKIDMLKPHLGDTDNFSRNDYNPSNYDTFFGIWGNYLEKLADLCTKYDIDTLCIGCEQFQNTKSIYTKYWLEIINNLHANFNSVHLTYAFSLYEFRSDDNLSIVEYLDYVGFNVYPNLTSELYSDDMTIADTASGWYSSPVDGFSFEKTINKIRDKYNKKVMITEVGATPYTYAINQSYSTGYPVDYKALALYIETIFYVVSRIENIIGIAWWHGETNGPFTFWSESETTSSETKMKEMIERY